MAVLRPITFVIEPCYAEALRAKTNHLSRQADEWWRVRKAQALRVASTYQEERIELGKAAKERADRRDSGELLDTLGAIVGLNLRVELASRGWLDRSWPRVPAGVSSLTGRPLGRKGRRKPLRLDEAGHEGPTADERWSEQLVVKLDSDLVETLRRSTYKVSQRAMKYVAAGRPVPDHVHPVVTPPDALRAAVRRATADWFPGPLASD